MKTYREDLGEGTGRRRPVSRFGILHVNAGNEVIVDYNLLVKSGEIRPVLWVRCIPVASTSL
jgi:hypothetical protein